MKSDILVIRCCRNSSSIWHFYFVRLFFPGSDTHSSNQGLVIKRHVTVCFYDISLASLYYTSRVVALIESLRPNGFVEMMLTCICNLLYSEDWAYSA